MYVFFFFFFPFLFLFFFIIFFWSEPQMQNNLSMREEDLARVLDLTC